VNGLLSQQCELWQSTLHWQPNACQQDQFQKLYALILQGNRQLNLTRITEPEEFWEKHLWDSLRGIQPWLKSNSLTPSQVIDIGTGAGFPGLPVAIACPEWHVTLVDSTRKKITFIEEMVQVLGLQKAVTLCDRAEQIGQHPQHREVYDLALIRAVATASVCAEYTLPLLKVGGMAVLYRGQWTEAEAIALEVALNQLGGQLESIEAFQIPMSQGERHCLYLRKTAPTPTAFPRAVGVPHKSPL
jgi:16S rRNA (guanine527-N7)-methyltransferase